MEANFVLRLLKDPLEAGQGTQQETGYVDLNWETIKMEAQVYYYPKMLNTDTLLPLTSFH